MKISRIWAMPNKWTFTIKPIKELLSKYVYKGCWCDPFAGENSPAQTKNDLSGKVEFCMDGLDFLKSRKRDEFYGLLYDPPYSIRQAKECYEGRGAELLKIKATSMEYWSKCKNNVSRIIMSGGIVICCGWNSMGIGKKRGFKMLEVLLVPHGGSKNDTIVTVERKITQDLF